MLTADILKLVLALLVVDYIRINYLYKEDNGENKERLIEDYSSDPIKVISEEGKEINVKYEGGYNPKSKDYDNSSNIDIKILYCSS
jgi:hypothetical protein